MSKLQGNSFKTGTEAGNDNRLTKDNQVYVTANSINKTLYQSIVDGDIGGGITVVNNSTTGAIDGSSYVNENIIVHLANDTATYTLPTAVAGTRLKFIHKGVNNTSVSNEMRIKPNTGDEIAWGNKLTITPGYFSVEKRGVAVSLIAIDTTTWVVEKISGLSHLKNTSIGYDKDVALIGRDSWVTKAVLPAVRHGAGAFNLVHAYVANGTSGGASQLNTQYDDSTDSWTAKTVVGNAKVYTGGFAVNGYGYVGGGDNGGRVSNFDQYNESANTWSAKTAIPTAKINAQASPAINGYGYFAGGDDGASTVTTTNRYNDSANSWAAVASLNAARADHVCWDLNGYIYAANGYTSGVINSVEQFNDSLNSWIYRATAGTARQGVAGFKNNGYGYVCNGNTGADSNEVNQYNDTLNAWTSKATGGTARDYASSFAMRGFGYIAGGHAGSSSTEVNQYN